MKQITDILTGIQNYRSIGPTDMEITGICFDSRQAAAGNIFIAVKGTRVDGHDFIQDAISKGCTAIVCETLPGKTAQEICYIRVEDAGYALGLICSNYFDQPSGKLKLIGITGTNGKTTIATLLYRLVTKLGCRAGLISTIEVLISGRSQEATHTTPDALQINQLLADMVNQDCSYCFMEVSSHSIDQQRIAGLQFAGGIFTNLTHEHLDYHTDFRHYLNSKKVFFDHLPADAFALTNLDDRNGKVMVQNSEAKTKTYSLRSLSDYKGKIMEKHFDGTQLKINDRDVWTSFIGEFNAYNILAVYACCVLLSLEKESVLTALSELKPVRGRAEVVTGESGIVAIVDYAHTPDALKNIIQSVNQIRSGGQKLITVVGAGGNRDRTKRPLMGDIAASGSDRVILTSDNPRNESPEAIIDEIKSGISETGMKKVIAIVDRHEAIKTAIMLANKGDIVLVAGKGHETYQDIAGEKIHFDDLEVIRQIMNL
ncbi:MAG: UDP-N-acetylmuramoyl-L-alanyl-D-glutamate--2,6-diaminopimelate ligase [Bacteroidales bacterium]|nr:UDP-N-acetylmuramoyl-L-alanyl-D-glutamate--2,6-diaminopimelate ligase [Bacteroidales bacterium]